MLEEEQRNVRVSEFGDGFQARGAFPMPTHLSLPPRLQGPGPMPSCFKMRGPRVSERIDVIPTAAVGAVKRDLHSFVYALTGAPSKKIFFFFN